MGRHRLATAMVAIAPAQPSLWDVPAAAAVVAVVPKPAKPKPVMSPRTVPLSLGGKLRPDRDTRLAVAGEGEYEVGEHYAWAGEMACGRERHYALLVRYDERDEAMAPRRCVSVERVRVVVSE